MWHGLGKKTQGQVRGSAGSDGGHRSSGWAVACELLAGALTGSGACGPGEGPYNGMLSVYIDPKVTDDGHDFGVAVNEYIEFVRGGASRRWL